MRFLPVFVIILLVSSCVSEPDCISGPSNNMVFRMRDSKNNAVKKVIFSSILISGTPATVPADSVSSIVIPLDPTMNETTYNFSYTYSYLSNTTPVVRNDQITIVYTSQNIIVSTTCPPYILFSNLDVSAYSFTEKPLVLNRQLLTGVTPATINIDIKF